MIDVATGVDKLRRLGFGVGCLNPQNIFYEGESQQGRGKIFLKEVQELYTIPQKDKRGGWPYYGDYDEEEFRPMEDVKAVVVIYLELLLHSKNMHAAFLHFSKHIA